MDVSHTQLIISPKLTDMSDMSTLPMLCCFAKAPTRDTQFIHMSASEGLVNAIYFYLNHIWPSL